MSGTAALESFKETSTRTHADPVHDTVEKPTTTGFDEKENDAAAAVKPNGNAHIIAEKETPSTEPHDEDVEYPHGLKLAVILAALCLAVFLVALDNTIISTAIPKITDQFHSIRDIGWCVTSNSSE